MAVVLKPEYLRYIRCLPVCGSDDRAGIFSDIRRLYGGNIRVRILRTVTLYGGGDIRSETFG
jgi:hypothetical protein